MDTAALDAKLHRLHDNRDRWARLDIGRKCELLDGVIDRCGALADQLVAASVAAKRIPPDSPVVGEEWFSGPVPVMRYLRFLRQTMRSIQERGEPPITSEQVRRHEHNGQAIVDVLPADPWDRALYPGFTAEVRMQPGVRAEAIQNDMASFYRQPDPTGAVNLVLTVANVSSIPPLDTLNKLYHEGNVCLVQLHPANDFIVPTLEEMFHEFIDEGFVDFAVGKADVGAYLVDHDKVDRIHITGSDLTHDAIVYGLGEEGERRKLTDKPRRDDLEITSALGNISPIIVVPGPWSTNDIAYHAESIATQIVANGGFNCNDAQLLITPHGWDRRDDLLDAIRDRLRDIPPRAAFYPGSYDRFDMFMEAYDHAEQFGRRNDELLPWGLIPDIDPTDRHSLCFNEETFCGVLCETSLEAPDTGYYLARAVDFCNERLWGSLCASIIVHPDVAQPNSADVEAAVGDLEYGTVVVNHWPALAYGLGMTPWGAYPGHTYRDIQSGIGFTHNAYMFDRPQKTVMRGPFRTRMRPPWFASHQRAHKLGPRLLELEKNPSVRPLLRVLWQEFRG